MQIYIEQHYIGPKFIRIDCIVDGKDETKIIGRDAFETYADNNDLREFWYHTGYSEDMGDGPDGVMDWDEYYHSKGCKDDLVTYIHLLEDARVFDDVKKAVNNITSSYKRAI